ncbi:U32 family peptidase [bacterium]|nr:U32 family peptidase [bacterium]MBU3956349.1 U32 family peptidase [bacterium]MBU4134451.1 U32 family peptidase [bacterium]
MSRPDPQLLAPVGSKDALIAAVRAGADAVYIGAPGFNARLKAANITFYDMAVLIDYAHENNVKVFAAMNTLIKHAEMHEAVKIISGIDKLGADAFIIQDLGLAAIISKYFENIEMHASTQLAAHNRMGVEALAASGFKRVILARELSYPELKIIAKGSPAEIEVFCHGAICFSVSGQCLFSSFIGGHSGNRGRCTQPCRRIWLQGKRRGYLFSPRDMELARHVRKLKKIGIASLKIEGRMRSAEYVYRTVKAYRLLLDASDENFSEASAEAHKILSEDTAREKTTCLFSGRDENIFQPEKAQCLGNRIGEVEEAAKDSVTITLLDGMPGNKSRNAASAGADATPVTISRGDRIRLSNPEKDITRAFKVKDFTVDGGRYTFALENADDFKKGNPAFRTSDAVTDQKDIEKDVNAMYKNYQLKNKGKVVRVYQVPQSYTAFISNKWNKAKTNVRESDGAETLWIRFSDVRWLDALLRRDKKPRLVFSLNLENINQRDEIIRRAGNDITMELPPFIGQRDIQLFKRQIENMISMGVKRWTLNNISQIGFFEGAGCSLSAGQFLYTWNAYAAAFLDDRGISSFNVSWEDDSLNVRDLSGPVPGERMLIYLYGYPPVVRSRILMPDYIGHELIQENDKISREIKVKGKAAFLPVSESKLTLLIPAEPLCLFSSRRKLLSMGIRNFGIDLGFIQPDGKFLNTLVDSYNESESIPGSVRFNFKRGVK